MSSFQLSKRHRYLKPVALAVFIFLTFLIYSTTHTNLSPSQISRYPKSLSNPLRSQKLVNFWSKFLDILVEADPKIGNIRPERSATSADESADVKTTSRLDVIHLSDDEVRAMRQSHESVVHAIQTINTNLPFEAGTKGVVITAGGRYFSMAMISVRMLRRSGSLLPVQVFLDSWADYDIDICERILPSLGARCFVLNELWERTPKLAKLVKYQFKVFALLFSGFEDILFLDADAFPAINPDHLFEVEPFTSTGLVTFPDFWVSTTSPLYYRIAGLSVPHLAERRSSESGIMLFSKKKHASSLLLATYYNYYGPDYYYPLFSQGAIGEGDKETFLHAALALNNTFYDVKTGVGVLGQWVDHEWQTAALKQADPVEDYLLNNAVSSQKKLDVEVKRTDAKPFFIHHNIVKLDVKHLFDDKNAWWSKEPKRLLGDRESVVRDFGSDVEVSLWEEFIAGSCDVGSQQCSMAKKHANTVLGKDF